jgi:hypothetical protein
MAAKLARLTQNSNRTAPSDRELYHLQFSPKRPVRKLLDTPSYTFVTDCLVLVNIRGKGKVPVLLTEYYAMKAYWGIGSITPLIR